MFAPSGPIREFPGPGGGQAGAPGEDTMEAAIHGTHSTKRLEIDRRLVKYRLGPVTGRDTL
jgi:hypothetical protein